jgi:prefoldin subunit 5
MRQKISKRLQATFDTAEKVIIAIKAGQLTAKEADDANRTLARDVNELEEQLKQH